MIALSHLDDPLEHRVGYRRAAPSRASRRKIVDPETARGAPASASAARSPTAARACSRATTRTPSRPRSPSTRDGFFHSGDLGRIDADGRLSYLGRIKDMLKVGGENVAAAEIEGFLAEHPAIAEVQVVAAPDRRYDEVPCAFVELRPGARARPRTS